MLWLALAPCPLGYDEEAWVVVVPNARGQKRAPCPAQSGKRQPDQPVPVRDAPVRTCGACRADGTAMSPSLAKGSNHRRAKQSRAGDGSW
nr:unnamed protein product [Digitaria exilis]